MIGAELGGYRILDELGAGGMGTVYKAVDTSLDRIVAVKVLNPEFAANATLLERFRMEARAQASLNHPNVAMLHAFVTHGGQAWMVMEYVDGETIAHMLARRGLLPAQVAAPLFKQALLGIGYAHRMGIVHRDIKPSNLMVNSHGMLKVMDFGIAKVMGSRGMTRTGAQIGSVSYMSPEQVLNRPVDTRSDIYALGVTLFEMLTAHLPFAGEGDFQIMSDHVHQPPPSPTRYYPHIPRNMENAVLRALAKDPNSRFQTVEEFGSALDAPESVAPAPPKTVVPLPAAAPLPPVFAPAPQPPTATPLDRTRILVVAICGTALMVIILAGLWWFYSAATSSQAQLSPPPPVSTPAAPAAEQAAGLHTAAPVELKILNFDATLKHVSAGQKVLLAWLVQGASQVTITPDAGDVEARGSKEVAVARTTEFKLIARNARGEETERSVTVEVAPETAATAVDRVRQALGGAAALDGLRDWYGTCEVSTKQTNGSAYAGTLVMRWCAPNAIRFDTPPSKTSAGRDTFFDGAQVWERDIPVGGEGSKKWDPVNSDPKSKEGFYARFWHQLAFLLPPMLFRNGAASTTELTGPGILVLADGGGNRVRVTSDRATGLPLKITYDGIVFNAWHPGASEIRLSGWRDTGAVKSPFQWTLYQNGAEVSEMRFQTVRVNQGLTLEQLRNLPPER